MSRANVTAGCVPEIYAEGQRYFMGEGKLNNALTPLVADLLKLASGMTAPDRLKDLADVQELIKIRGLSSEFAVQLNPYVRGEFLKLLAAVQLGSRNNIEGQL